MADAGKKKYDELRAHLLARGWTLLRFARWRGYAAMTVYDAARRRRHGEKSRRIQKELEDFINV